MNSIWNEICFILFMAAYRLVSILLFIGFHILGIWVLLELLPWLL